MIRRPPRSPLFPSPTPFRSAVSTIHPYTRRAHSSCGLLEVSHVSRVPPPNPFRRRVGCRIADGGEWEDRKSTRLNSSHANISYAVFCLKKKIFYSLSLSAGL